MRKSIVALVVLAFFVLSLTPAFAVTAAKPAAKGVCPAMGKACDTKTKGATDKACDMKTKGTADKCCPYTMKGAKKGGACPMPGMSAKKPASAVCAVMGNKIPDVSKAVGKSTYKGKTYYFCCKGCKPMFDKNPEKYIKKTGNRAAKK